MKNNKYWNFRTFIHFLSKMLFILSIYTKIHICAEFWQFVIKFWEINKFYPCFKPDFHSGPILDLDSGILGGWNQCFSACQHWTKSKYQKSVIKMYIVGVISVSRVWQIWFLSILVQFHLCQYCLQSHIEIVLIK
jgi:hypothetical protein